MEIIIYIFKKNQHGFHCTHLMERGVMFPTAHGHGAALNVTILQRGRQKVTIFAINYIVNWKPNMPRGSNR